MWDSDTAPHFKNRVIVQLTDALKVQGQFAVVRTPRSNGARERTVKEVIRSSQSLLSEQRPPVAKWVDVLPAAQWALKTFFCERYRNTPILSCSVVRRVPRFPPQLLSLPARGTSMSGILISCVAGFGAWLTSKWGFVTKYKLLRGVSRDQNASLLRAKLYCPSLPLMISCCIHVFVGKVCRPS